MKTLLINLLVVAALIAGQVLQNINIESYLERTVPSLKDLQREISGGSDLGALSLLRFAMQIIQRWVPSQNSRMSKQNILELVIRSKKLVLSC